MKIELAHYPTYSKFVGGKGDEVRKRLGATKDRVMGYTKPDLWPLSTVNLFEQDKTLLVRKMKEAKNADKHSLADTPVTILHLIHYYLEI